MNNINQVKLFVEIDPTGVSVHIEGGATLRLDREIKDVGTYDPTQDLLLNQLIRGVIGAEGKLVELNETGGAL